MRVIFKQDWTYMGNEPGFYYMKDFKAGDNVCLTTAQAEKAQLMGVVDVVKGRKPTAVARKDESLAEGGSAGNEEGDHAFG